ncbi:L,D-transpeptidase family protein [Aerococcus sp. UMB7834]|uniref:L,D-transpeptidase family protein n=1 Tax=Aerococcus sp. UMB7834 TaxID=3046342 RepID=UPI00254BA8C4|nr:L,D-transpeptidase family protein [Aerococcus sp. UMB7834]MDK6805034.1 L,D-transpeptidase family protein [Aerococcus sp. UMB7834]
MSRQNESSKGLVWGLVIALVAVLGLYGGGAYYYSQHFLPRTQVSATKVSNMNLEEADKKVSEKIAGQTIDVKEGDKEVAQLPIDSLGLPIESQIALKKMLDEQNQWAWPLAFFTDRQLQGKYVDGDLDGATIDKIMNQLGIDNSQRKESENARLENSSDQGFTVVDSVQGNQISADALQDLFNKNIDNGNYQVNLADAYIQPTLKEDDPSLQSKIKKLDDIKGSKLVLKVDGKEHQIPEEEIASWLYIDDQGEPAVDMDQVNVYLQGLNQEISGLLTSHDFQSTMAGVVTVQPGTYGWYIDRSKAADEVAQAALKGKDTVIEPSIAGSGYGQDNFFGQDYVEVDMINQKMFIYLNGELQLSTDIVSGHDMTPTNPGAFAVNNMQSPSVLRGYDPKTGNKYASPVSYWVPFDYVGQGIHDANWQPVFGGGWYHQNGSNGCINVQPSVMPTVYSLVHVGMPVVVFN